MPRIPRKNLQSAYCHVIVQGINKEYIFKENRFKDIYKNLLKKNAKKEDVKILAYCIMDNHAHILIYSEAPDKITKLMRKVNTCFAMIYNSQNKRVGYVFRDRYNTQMILSENQLFNCLVYIHNNPVKARMVSNMSMYKYSSYNEYKTKNMNLITREGIKLVFGSEKKYFEMFNEIHKRNDIEDIKEIKERVDSKKIIESFLNENGNDINEIFANEAKLRNLIMRLRHEGRIAIKRNGKSVGNWKK